MNGILIGAAILIAGLVLWLVLQSFQEQRKSGLLEAQLTELRRDLQTIATAHAQSSGQMGTIGQNVSQRLESVTKALQEGVSNSAQIATQPEAEGGLENSKIMTPLRVKQAVDAYGLLQTDIGTTAGTVASGADFRFRIPSVRAFGALLDGVTDDSAAIQPS